MSSMNPLSIPGGWSKDKNQSKGSPATEKKDPTEDTSVPRSAAGTVNDAGEIIDQSGKSIGKIPDSKDPQDLAGNTVTAAGDIVGETGDVLGKATGLDLGADDKDEHEHEHDEAASEYTTKGVEEGDDSSGFNVVGKARGALSGISGLAGSFRGSQAGGSQAGGSQADIPDTSKVTGDVQEQTEGLQDKAMETGENLPSADDVKGEADDKAEEATGTAADAQDEVAQKPIELKDETGELKTDEATGKTEELAAGAQDTAAEAKDEAEGKTEDLKDQAEQTGDATEKVDELKGDAEKTLGETAEKTDDVKDIADEKTEELKDQTEQPGDVTEKADELQDQTEQTGDATDKLQELEPEAEKTTDETADKTEELAGGAEQAAEGVTEKTDELKDEADEKTEEAKAEAGEKTEEAEEQLEGAKEGADVPDVDEAAEKVEEEAPLDFSVLKGTKVNKGGNLVNEKGDIIGKVVEGHVKQLVGKSCDENGDIWDSSGKKVGRAEPHSEADRQDLLKEFSPFENFPGAVVEADGRVLFEGRQVGTVIDGDPKRLKGATVDADGDITDRRGNVVGKAEAWDEPEAEPEVEVDNSALAGKRVNKAGNLVDSSGNIFGRVIEGNVKSMIGRMANKKGEILSESGDVIGKAELVAEGEREGQKEGPFAELSGCTVAKDGTVVTPAGDIVGRLISGDAKKLAGRHVDDEGEIVDANGNVLGKAERWEPEEVEKKKGPMAGMKLTKEGNVLDDSGNVMGKLIKGDALICAGKEIDDDGDVLNSKGQTVGHVVLLEDVPEEPKVEEEESPEDKEKREQAEKDKKLANQLGYQIEQSLEKIRPICKRINDRIDAEERKPKEERDEEELVKQVKPLIEDGGKILTECNGVIRGMDPDGRIQRNAKQKAASREATPEEFHLADLLKELTGSVTECIDNAKRKLENMPKAKKQLNPLWGLLSEPLFQILAAVGLLLNGVLGIVGRLLSGLGLGGLVDGLLGSLGLDKILGGLGLGDALGALTGKKK